MENSDKKMVIKGIDIPFMDTNVPFPSKESNTEIYNDAS